MIKIKPSSTIIKMTGNDLVPLSMKLQKGLIFDMPLHKPYAGTLIGSVEAYSSDFSAGVDGWGSTRTVLAGNIDDIGGQDDNLRATLTADAGTHILRKGNFTTVGQSYELSFDFYVPSGNDYVDGVYLPSNYYGSNMYFNAVEEWTHVSFLYTALQIRIVIYAADGTSKLITDANANDVFYLRNVVVSTPTSGVVRDRSVFSNDGSVLGAEIGNISATFNGTSNYINVPATELFSFGNGTTDKPFSICAWVNMIDATSFVIATKGEPGVDGEWNFSNDHLGHLHLSIYNYEDGNSHYSSRYYDEDLSSYENQWIHLAATYDGRGGVDASNGMNIYLNGIKVDDSDGSYGTYVAMENLSCDVWIGRRENAYSEGQISNLKIYNKVLSTTEIIKIINSQRRLFGI